MIEIAQEMIGVMMVPIETERATNTGRKRERNTTNDLKNTDTNTVDTGTGLDHHLIHALVPVIRRGLTRGRTKVDTGAFEAIAEAGVLLGMVDISMKIEVEAGVNRVMRITSGRSLSLHRWRRRRL